MHGEVEAFPALADRAEQGVHAGTVGDVCMEHECAAELLCQWHDALLQRLTLVGDAKLGALCRNRLGNAPGQRSFVGYPHDQAALAGHERCTVGHGRALLACRLF